MWVHMCKERFPTQRKLKLHPRGNRLFQVLERINDNAYKLDLPSNCGNVNATFNVVDLSLFDVGDMRMNHFEEGAMIEIIMLTKGIISIFKTHCKELAVQ